MNRRLRVWKLHWITHFLAVFPTRMSASGQLWASLLQPFLAVLQWNVPSSMITRRHVGYFDVHICLEERLARFLPSLTPKAPELLSSILQRCFLFSVTSPLQLKLQLVHTSTAYRWHPSYTYALDGTPLAYCGTAWHFSLWPSTLPQHRPQQTMAFFTLRSRLYYITTATLYHYLVPSADGGQRMEKTRSARCEI